MMIPATWASNGSELTQFVASFNRCPTEEKRSVVEPKLGALPPELPATWPAGPFWIAPPYSITR